MAAILAERRDLGVHLEADSFFRFIRAGHVEPWKPESQAQNEAVMGIVARAAVGYAQAGYFTVVEGVLIPGWFLEPLLETLRGGGRAVACAVLRAPLEMCIERVQNRAGEPPIDAGIMERIWRGFTDLGEFEGNALDVERIDAEGVSDLLERRLHRLAV